LEPFIQNIFLEQEYRMSFDPAVIRSQFPSLRLESEKPYPAVFLDNPGGTQITQKALDRMNQYLVAHNANHGGAFRTSKESDLVLEEAHAAMADFYNAASPNEIVFGNNMTTLTLHISRSIARTWNPGDIILVTRLDHDANITPWVLAAEDRGCQIRWIDFNPDDGTLDLDDFQRALSEKPRLVAVGYASNALGTVNPVAEIVDMAHSVGAQVFIDAVQYGPHGPIDVQQLGCDFLVTSAYKFFGPHVGILYGRYELLEQLFSYKVRPAPDDPPGKFETGTQNHEGIAGVLGTLEYLEWLGESFGEQYSEMYANHFDGRKLRLKQAMEAIKLNEYDLSRAILEVLQETPGVTIFGLTDSSRLSERVPTFAFNLKGFHPRQVARQLGEQGFNIWDGNYYALAVTERLAVEASGGMVRVGPVHYNTIEEIYRFGEALRNLAAPGG
jgi:cysteine desulfurase family protein (TIGR01976 family)